jgi:hypothetical protein
MVPAPPARVSVGGVSPMGSFDKNFYEKKVAASFCVTAWILSTPRVSRCSNMGYARL